jgi:DNA-binding MarR family transcriptional regulator
MKSKDGCFDETANRLYINLQKIFRCLDIGRSTQGRTTSLTLTQMRILSFFNDKEVVYISEISRYLGMSLQSVNNLVSRLEALGYVERSQNKDDKRLSDIRLTAKGRESFEVFRTDQYDTLTGMLGRLEPVERNILGATIENAALILEKAALKESGGKHKKKSGE